MEALRPEFNEVVAFAYVKHAGQFRHLNNEPYINHCIRVALDVQRHGGTYNQIAAALLHDTLEDTDTTYDEIREVFGYEIAEIVSDLTDVYTPQKYPNLNRAKRKALEAERLKTILPEARLVKICDVIDNTDSVVRGIFKDPGFVMVYLREKIVVLEALGFK